MMNASSASNGFVFFSLNTVLRWARQNSLSYLTANLLCCGIEVEQAEGGRFDIERFGASEVCSPQQADLLIVAGSISHKIIPELINVYNLMQSPKYVIALGSCACTGGMFNGEKSYNCISGVDKILPVDVYVPGCPPRPEAILHGLITLQKKIKNQNPEIMEPIGQVKV